MLFNNITAEQNQELINLYDKHIQMFQKEVFANINLNLSKNQVLKGMITYFSSSDVKDRNEILYHTIGNLACHKL